MRVWEGMAVKVKYSEDMETAFFGGYKFHKDKKSGYFLATKPTYRGKRERLHVFVWRYFYGPPAARQHIHHKDEDKNHNDIGNLICVSGRAHTRYHILKYAVNHQDELAENLALRARPKASEWHKSEAGRQWHRERGLPASVYEKVEKVCEFCHEKYWTVDHGNSRFCSNKCKAAARRESGVDNETRICSVCGKSFSANKYANKRFCSAECRAAFRKNQVHNTSGPPAGL